MMRILGITAHPDDEAGVFGGALLLYRSRGAETFVICLTEGTAASHRGGAKSNEELAALRRAEFANSCKILQVSEAQVLHYPDGALHRADLYAVVEDLALRIRQIKPHIIITMGTEGAITAHLDHAMASVFATMAFHWAARKDLYPEQLKNGLALHRAQKLYYSTASFIVPERPPVSPPPTSASIDIAPFVDKKIEAFRQHTSQAPLFPLFEKAMRKFGSKELFHLTAANQPMIQKQETDLFEGVIFD
jgi:LmbE family N-acetylglucosaminyl deacetylase